MAGLNPLTFNAWLSTVASLAIEQTTTVSGVNQFSSTPLQAIVPSILNYAEGRIARDLDLEQLLTTNNYTLTAANNVLSLPVGDFVAVQTFSIGGVPLVPVSKEFLQNVYGSSASQAQPQYFATYGGDSATAGNTSSNFIVGPYPDIGYTVNVTGYARAPSLYASATPSLAGSATTYISSYYPDLLVQASMLPISEYQRQFGAAANSPEMPGTYEAQYEQLLKSALVEEARKRFAAPAWSPMGPTPIATPTR